MCAAETYELKEGFWKEKKQEIPFHATLLSPVSQQTHDDSRRMVTVDIGAKIAFYTVNDNSSSLVTAGLCLFVFRHGDF